GASAARTPFRPWSRDRSQGKGPATALSPIPGFHHGPVLPRPQPVGAAPAPRFVSHREIPVPNHPVQPRLAIVIAFPGRYTPRFDSVSPDPEESHEKCCYPPGLP